MNRQRGTTLAGRIFAALMGLLLFMPSLLADEAKIERPPRPSKFQIGVEKSTDPRLGAYRLFQDKGMKKLDKALHDICPCLFIRVVRHKDAKNKKNQSTKGEIIVRQPGDIDDLPKDLQKSDFEPKSDKNKKKKKDELCDCYKNHRAGCNLIWKLATNDKQTTIWRSKTQDGDASSQGNKHQRGNVGWNPDRKKGGGTEALDKKGEPRKGQKGTNKRPPSVGLAHELAHALHTQEGHRGKSRIDEEFKATRAENQIRREMLAAEKRKKRPDKSRIARLSNRIEYSLDGTSHPVPDYKGKDIDTSDLLKCDKKDKKIGFLPWPVKPKTDEAYAYRVAIQTPKRCIATTYYLNVKTSRSSHSGEGMAITSNDPPPEAMVMAPSDPVTDDPEGFVPECGRQPMPISISIPRPAPTSASQTDTPKIQTPQPTQEPPDETGKDEDQPDLGLVKAGSSVVNLVLRGEQTGDPVNGVVIKLQSPPPALPLTKETDPTLVNINHYQAEVAATTPDKNGDITLGEWQDDPTSSANTAPDKSPSRPKALPVSVKIRQKADGRAIVALKPGNSTLLSQNGRLKLLRKVAGGSAKLCVSNSFKIGPTPVFVVNMPLLDASKVKQHISQNKGVEFVEDDPCRNKEGRDDPHFKGSGLWGQFFANQWAIRKVGYRNDKTSAWSHLNNKSTPVKVAIVDTGLDWYHPDLAQSSIWKNKGEIPANDIDDDGNGYVDDVIGWNFIDHNHKPWDYDGHGTFVTGIIAAGRNNGIGISGINPSAQIMVLKALDSFGNGHASTIAQAISYAADNKAKIINLSLGGPGLTKIEKLAVKHARKSGAIMVVAAGNSAKSVAKFSPAGLHDVITVAATDRKNHRAGFSNWGPQIDIAAPGVDVLSLRARNTDLLSYIRNVDYDVGTGIVGTDRAYFRASGTSFATPIVSGTLSLLLAENPSLTPEQLTRMILNSAVDIETPGIDNYTGYGVLDASAALTADPDYFIESRISGIKVIKRSGKLSLQVIGTTKADKFSHATIMLGKGKKPKKWFRLKRKISASITSGALMNLPATLFRGAKQWTIRLITVHKDGTKREARFALKLG